MGTTARPLPCAWGRPHGPSLARGSDRLAALSVSGCPCVCAADCWCVWGSVAVCACACVNVYSRALCHVWRGRSVKSGGDRAAAPAFVGTTGRPLPCAWERPRGRSLARGRDRLAAVSVSGCPCLCCWLLLCLWLGGCACVCVCVCVCACACGNVIHMHSVKSGANVRSS